MHKTEQIIICSVFYLLEQIFTEILKMCGENCNFHTLSNTRTKSETDKAIGEADRYSVRKRLENYKQRQNEQKHEKHQLSHDDEDELEL